MKQAVLARIMSARAGFVQASPEAPRNVSQPNRPLSMALRFAVRLMYNPALLRAILVEYRLA